MLKDWKTLTNNRAYLLGFICLVLLTIAMLKVFSMFLLYNETRTEGYQLNDFVLNLIPATLVSFPLFLINWTGIFMGIIVALRTPKGAAGLFIAVMLLAFFRGLSMFLFPLLPPEGIIPLRDCFLECLFYGDQVLLRDLFFSGHTASLVVLFFFADIKYVKYFLGFAACAVGILLLVQHVHYTIDVLVAPFFSYLAYFMAKKATDFVNQKFKPQSEVETVFTGVSL